MHQEKLVLPGQKCVRVPDPLSELLRLPGQQGADSFTDIQHAATIAGENEAMMKGL